MGKGQGKELTRKISGWVERAVKGMGEQNGMVMTYHLHRWHEEAETPLEW